MHVLPQTELEPLRSEIVARLRAALSPVAIYLFGSYAYGTPSPGSAVDLVVIVADSPLDPYERDAVAYRALGDVPVPLMSRSTRKANSTSGRRCASHSSGP
jgi:predicted nucleotidyltransferase